MSAGISRDEWLRALKDAGLVEQNDPDALTASEFAEMFGISQQSARRRLGVLVSTGAAMVTRKRIPGRASAVAYRLIQLPTKKGRKH